MALGIIDSIRKSEAESSEIRSDAHARAKEILLLAEKNGEELKISMEKSAEEEAKKIILLAEKESEDIKDRQRKELDTISKDLSDKANELKDKAVKMITEEICSL